MLCIHTANVEYSKQTKVTKVLSQCVFVVPYLGLTAVVLVQDVEGVEVWRSSQQTGRKQVSLETKEPPDPPSWNRPC